MKCIKLSNSRLHFKCMLQLIERFGEKGMNAYLFLSNLSSRFRCASSVSCCGLVMELPVVAITTPCGNVVGVAVAIWYACMLPAERIKMYD